MQIFDHEKGRVAVAEKLRGVGFDSTKGKKYLMYGGPASMLVGSLFIMIGFIINGMKSVKEVPNIDPNHPPKLTSVFHVHPLSIIGIIILIAGLGALIYLSFVYIRTAKKNAQKLKKYGFELHQIYFDAAISQNYQGLKIKNYQGSGYRSNGCNLTLDFNGREIFWNIDEDIETRTETDSKGEKDTYKVYILKSHLENQVPEINGLAPIDITQGDATKFFARQNCWQSESIEFNQRYRVSYEDEFGMVKLFTPKVIDKFNKSLNNFDGRLMHLENGACKIDYRSHFENITSNRPNFLDWTGVDWGKKSNHIRKVAEKIELDFTRFEENQVLLEPFEFGKQNQTVENL